MNFFLGRRKREKASTAKQEMEQSTSLGNKNETNPLKPHQERPRICLVDVNKEIADALSSRGFNCYKGTLGPLVEVPNVAKRDFHEVLPNPDFPPNLHEYDIIVVDLQNPITCQYVAKDHRRTQSKGQSQVSIISSYPQTVFDPRPLSASLL